MRARSGDGFFFRDSSAVPPRVVQLCGYCLAGCDRGASHAISAAQWEARCRVRESLWGAMDLRHFCRCRESARESSFQEEPPRGHCVAGDDRSCLSVPFRPVRVSRRSRLFCQVAAEGINQAVFCYSPFRHVHVSLAWSVRLIGG